MSLIALAPLLLAPHPNSFSISEIHVRGAAVELHLRCQVLSLGEVIEPFDPELDGHAEDGEIEAHAEAIADYVEQHYRFVPGARENDEARDPALAMTRIDALVVAAPVALDPMNEVSEWVDVRLQFRSAAEDFESLGVYVDLFEVTSPGHRDSAALVWNGVEEEVRQFAIGASEHVFEASEEALARAAPPFGRYLALAPAAVARAFDVALLALLFALAAGPTRRSAFVSVGLFLVAFVGGAFLAPSIDLAPRQVRFLELTVPLALAYVALDDLLHRVGRTRIVEPLVFGVAAGARSAVELAPELAREAGTTEPLAGHVVGFVATLGAGLLLVAILVTRGGQDDAREAF
ncbi:MAG: hypothetical protein AAGA20_22295, partial [Planctomycetota bacterium]